jgi:peroxiredoxin
MIKKLSISAVFISLAIFLFAFRFSGNVIPIGSDLPVPDLKLKDVRGKEVSMKECVKKNGLLVMFSCNSCPYVRKNQERTKSICNYALQNNIGVILLNSNEDDRESDESYEAMQAYAKSQNYTWNYVVDKYNKVADAFGANRTPECFLFNSSLKLSYHGAIDDNPADAGNVNREHLKEAIKELLAGKEIAVKESRSVGCTIHRRGA